MLSLSSRTLTRSRPSGVPDALSKFSRVALHQMIQQEPPRVPGLTTEKAQWPNGVRGDLLNRVATMRAHVSPVLSFLLERFYKTRPQNPGGKCEHADAEHGNDRS